MESRDGFLSGLRTVSHVPLLVKANKREGTLNSILLANLGLEKDAQDLAIWSEDFPQVGLSPSWVEILDVDVVENLANLSDISRFELVNFNEIEVFGGNSCVCIFLVLEADKPVPVRGLRYKAEIIVTLLDAERHLCRLYRAKSGREELVETLRIYFRT